MTEFPERRKQDEIDFHDRLRAVYRRDPERYGRFTANDKYYSIVRRRNVYVEAWLSEHARGARVLDYGCGAGDTSMKLARWARHVVGIDLSPASIRISVDRAEKAGVDSAEFHVMDCEALKFPDASFDVVVEMGVLHHLDLDRAYAEIARVLRPGGFAIRTEALGHNPVIRLYRRLTPHLRTAWETEHILHSWDIAKARQYFSSVDVRLFHLATLAAVPLRGTRLFSPTLAALELLDSMLLRVRALRWWAWEAVMVLQR